MAASSASYSARENPANITGANKNVDQKTLAIMADIYLSLGKVGMDVNQSDFSSANIDFRDFRTLYDNNKDTIRYLYKTDADAQAALESTDLTMDDIQAYLDAATDYNQTYWSYQNYVANGDMANASIESVRLQDQYALMNKSYKNMVASTHVSMDWLNNTNQKSINSSLLTPFLDSTNHTMTKMGVENQAIQVASRHYAISIASGPAQAKIGDMVIYTAILKSSNGSVVGGATIGLFANGRQVSSGITDVSGICQIPYTVPNNIVQDQIRMYFEYVPQEPGEPPTLSNIIYLDILDEGSALSLSISPVEVSYGDMVNVTGKLVATRGFPADNCTVDVFLNNVSLGRAVTGNDGAYNLRFYVTERMPGGNCTVTAAHVQSAGNIFMNSSSPAAQLNIVPQGSSITAGISDAHVTMGDDIFINGTLSTEKGLRVAGADVLAYVGNECIGNSTTDNSGFFTIRAMVPYGSEEGNNSLYAVYMPSGGALEGSASSRYMLRIDTVRPVLSANSTALMLFSNDMLQVTGAVCTDAGVPIRNETVTVRVSDSVGGTVVTDQHGAFSFTRVINSYDPAGYYDISVSLASPDGSGAISTTAGRIFIIPYDKVMIIAAVFAALALLLAIFIFSITGMKPDRLARLVRGRAKPVEEEIITEPTFDDHQVDEPIAYVPVRVPGEIGELIGADGFKGAATSMYTTARKMVASRGVTVRDSDTHREFYGAAIVSYPDIADSLRPVVDTYEHIIYGHMDVTDAEMQTAFNGLKSVHAAINGDDGP